MTSKLIQAIHLITGPWFRTQLLLSLSLGIFSLFIFEVLRRRWRNIYMGRATLKEQEFGDPAEDHPGVFGWIRPVLRVSDSRIVQTVGLDAVVVSSF